MPDPVSAPVAPAVPASAPVVPAAKPAAAPVVKAEPKAVEKKASPEVPVVEKQKEEIIPEAPAKKKFTFKVNGKEVVEEFTDEEIHKYLQNRSAGQMSLKEAAKIKKDAGAVLEAVRSGDFNFLAKIGIENPREFVSKWLVEQMNAEIAESKLTPEQRENRDLKKKLDEISQKDKAAQTVKETADLNALKTEYTENFKKEITDIAEENGLKVNKVVLQRSAYYLLESRNAARSCDAQAQEAEAAGEVDQAEKLRKDAEGYRAITLRHIMPEVKKEMNEYIRQFFDTSKPEQYYEILGDNIKKLRQAEMAKIDKKPKKNSAPKAKSESKKKSYRNQNPFDGI